MNACTLAFDLLGTVLHRVHFPTRPGQTFCECDQTGGPFNFEMLEDGKWGCASCGNGVLAKVYGYTSCGARRLEGSVAAFPGLGGGHCTPHQSSYRVRTFVS
jgi:hypothetical protein